MKRGFAIALLTLAPAVMAAQTAAPQAAPAGRQEPGRPAPQQPPIVQETITVVETAPLPGVDLTPDQVPSPVQTATAQDLLSSGALDLSAFMNRRLSGVHVNEIQGNPFQSDVNYRGYTASALLGTPQGLSVYMDGVRLNQPFGDVVSWDLIPRRAIQSTTLMPGSNPLFGLNTLGGALSLRTKDGLTAAGTTLQANYGGDRRRAFEVEHGGHTDAGLAWYVTGNLFAEDGWREDSASTVRQIFGKLGWQRTRHDVSVTGAYANNALHGNGLQETHWLDRSYSSVYTKPDITNTRSTFINIGTSHVLGNGYTVSGNGYYRDIRAKTLNGDLNDDSLDQAIYQPSAAERNALAAAGYSGFPLAGATAENTPFPVWRCLGNVLLNDEPGEKCNGLLNRTRTRQRNGGAAGQVTKQTAMTSTVNQFTVGAAFDRSRVGFVQSTELGYLNPDRSVAGTGAFADGGVTGGTVDGEPFDTRVDLDGLVRTWSLYATDTVSIAGAWHVTISARYNTSRIENRDQIEPGGGEGSLDGDHVFGRLNPAAGFTYSPSRDLNFYAGWSEGSRAPTSVELGCASPDDPCKLPNAMVADPPLDEVVTRTYEGGMRGKYRGLTWNAGVFRSANRDDILFVTSEQAGFGFFKNFGETRRQGLEVGANRRLGRLNVGMNYSYLRATYESEETLLGAGNSTNDSAAAGFPGLDGSIEVEPGDRIPLMPAHTFKLYADIPISDRLDLNVDVSAISSVFARGNENNAHEPDGVYYLGPGASPGYAIVNLGASYRFASKVRLTGDVSNLFNRRYYTAAQLGSNGFTDSETFVARPFPAVNGEFPLRQATFFAPGAPARASISLVVTF